MGAIGDRCDGEKSEGVRPKRLAGRRAKATRVRSGPLESVSMAPARFVFWALLCFPWLTNAQQDRDTPIDLARQLVRLLGYETQMEMYRRQCLDTAILSPESLLKENPENTDRFGGATPASRHWPKVLTAYQEYLQEICARPTVSEVVDTTAQTYAAELTPSELKAAVEFYSTTSGKRLGRIHVNVYATILDLMSRAHVETVPLAERHFDRKIQAISELVEADRKRGR